MAARPGEDERLWKYASLVGEEGWTLLGSTDDSKFYTRDIDGTRLLLESSWLDIPEQKIMDGWKDPLPQCRRNFKPVEVEDINPDDMVVKFRVQSLMLRRLLALWMLSSGGADDGLMMRVIKRAAFPGSDQVTTIFAECDAKSRDMLHASERWSFTASAWTLTPSSGLTQRVMEIPHWVSGWMLAHTVKYVFAPCRAGFWDQGLPPPPPRERYVVVTVRGCRGDSPPLLRSADGTWQRQREESMVGFTLCDYLSHLLEVFKLDSLKAWPFADGRPVVPFEAVVLRKHVDEFWEAMRPIWGDMRRAYRATYGGAHGPKLTIAKNPHFLRPQLQERIQV